MKNLTSFISKYNSQAITNRWKVEVEYETSPSCSALQWLSPEQTAGKRHPYVFSQCQAIHSRSLVPCQVGGGGGKGLYCEMWRLCIQVMLGCFGYRERVGLRLSFVCLFCKLVSISGEFLYFLYLCWVGQHMRKRQEKECQLLFFSSLFCLPLYSYLVLQQRGGI